MCMRMIEGICSVQAWMKPCKSLGYLDLEQPQGEIRSCRHLAAQHREQGCGAEALHQLQDQKNRITSTKGKSKITLLPARKIYLCN